MIRDRVSLVVDGREYRNFSSYRVESDLFVADDAFEITFADSGVPILPGQRCKLFVNGVLELNGIIDRRRKSYRKSGSSLVVTGRDLMGLLVDTHVGVGRTDEKIELKDLAEDLLKNVPFIRRKAIIYGKGNKEKAVALDDVIEFDQVQIEPTRSIFDELKKQATARGLLFFCMPDGTFVFGSPKARGKAVFSFVCRKSGEGNNITEGELVEDLSRRYSSVHVISQGDDFMEFDDANMTGVSEDPSFPFEKPFYAQLAHDGKDPAKYAALIMNQQRFEGEQLIYKVAGHSQDGRNYQVNELCRVEDEPFERRGKYLIYSRVFERSKESGTTTTLKLSVPGVMPS